MKEVIYTEQAPAAIGPYSQAVKVGNQVFLSGQIGLDPQVMTLVSGGVSKQAEQVFNNIQSVARAAGGSLADVVKLTIYLVDAHDFPTVNEIMKHFLQQPYPARVTITVAELPLNAAIEIDAILILGLA